MMKYNEVTTERKDMFSVIQEVATKTVPAGESKGIEVYESRWTVNGQEFCSYEYRNSAERFDRPVRKSFRISIHESYRENGKVKKKQTVICTIGYYEVVDWGDWPGDFVVGGLTSKADVLGLEESELACLIYTKWQAIVDRIWEEYKQTEEYAARQENRRIINEHNERVAEFTEKYGVTRSEYNRCYDVFGKLRNPEYLKKIKADHKARKEYERRSREESRGYYEKFYGNYGGYNSSSYYSTTVSNYNEADKAILKKFYRTLSKAFHPDSNQGVDTTEEMKLLNCLKNDWGV